MTHGSDTSGETSDKLQAELQELLRQHEQYTMAMDAAVDPRTSLRLQRTIERLDEEIEGLREALAAYGSTSQPDSGDGRSSLVTQGVLPDWGDDDEPATSIYDPEKGLPGVDLPLSSAKPAPPEGGAIQRRAMYTDSVPTRRRSTGSPQPDAVGPDTVKLSDGGGYQPDPPRFGSGDDPATAVVTPAAPASVQPQRAPAPTPARTSTARPFTGSAPRSPSPTRPAAPSSSPFANYSDQDFESMNTLIEEEEPTWGHTQIVPPSPEERVGPTGPNPVVPAAPAAPSAPAPRVDSGPQSPFGGSPFGGPPPASPGHSTPFGTQPMVPYDYGASEPILAGNDGEWPLWSRIFLVVVVLAFLGGVAWILSQGP